MTHKGSQDNSDWIHRTGSHATRPLANGRFDLLPADARAAEDYFNSAKERWDLTRVQLTGARSRVLALKETLKKHMRYDDFKRIEAEYVDAVAVLKKMETQTGEYRVMARAAAENAYGTVFMYAARDYVDGATLANIDHEVQAILQRNRCGSVPSEKKVESTAKWAGEQEKRREQNAEGNRRERRKKFQNRYGSALAWSDELGGKVK